MKLHKEGYLTIIVTFFVLLGLTVGLIYVLPNVLFLQIGISLVPPWAYLRILYFFRVPNRKFHQNENTILSPADGEVVAIEEIYEDEFLKTNCIQVSVFMSPSNVHINWYPIAGTVAYYKYHPGKHLVAWHPKSSTLNERTSIALHLENGADILIRQVAGAMARRIVCYAKVDSQIKQAEELGFIKFGSRVDLFLPLGTKINVKLKDLVVGGITEIAKL